MMPLATVLIPTFDHGPMLHYSVRCALEQTVEDIEVFIVGDGSPDITREIAADFARRDARVRFFDNPKGPRHGELYRHRALAEARGEIVCYLSDDDLWLPDHVETMMGLLEHADYAHALTLLVDGNGSLIVSGIDLARPGDREEVLAGHLGTSLACMAHTLEMYRRLPYGWRTTPPGMFTDRYMQQQFLAETSCRAVSGTLPTVVHFISPQRLGWILDERIIELEQWQDNLGTPDGRDKFRREVSDLLVRELAVMRYRLEESTRELGATQSRLEESSSIIRGHTAWRARLESSRAWRLYNAFADVPIVGSTVRFIALRGASRPTPGGKEG